MDFRRIMIRGWKFVSKSLRAAADLILPRVCIVCGQELLLYERHICLHCLADLPLTQFWKLAHNSMADRFNAVLQCGLEEASTNCRERYAYAAALFFFSNDAPYRHIIYSIKYEGRTEVGRDFGRMLGFRLATADLFRDVDCVIPVPLHWTRRWRRGYNQAEIIAREVASALSADLDCKILVRRRRTRTQTKLDIKDKAANVTGAFGARRTLHRGNERHKADNPPELRHILLIDDVFTTGSTLHACFVALRSVFPPSVRISVATLGFVGGA